MSESNFVWKIRPETEIIPDNSISKLVDMCSTTLTTNLLKRRGNIELTIPSPMSGISSKKYREYYQPAIDKIVAHLKSGNPVLIYADCDVDGITAGVCMELLLISACANKSQISILAPDRISRGYGIKVNDITELTAVTEADNSKWLIVTVDCGTNDVEEVKALKALGYEIVITDHHLSEGEMPEDVILCNNKLIMPETIPEYGQSGCYVAAKVGCAVLEELNPLQRNAIHLADPLVALSILSDQIVIDSLAREQFNLGMRVLQSSDMSEFPGLLALLTDSYWKPGVPLTSTYLSFSIIPKLNSAGRCGKPNVAYQLLSYRNLLMEDIDEIKLKEIMTDKVKLVLALTSMNNDRKDYEARLLDEFLQEITDAKKANDDSYDKCLIMYKPEARIGVLGIVAARLTEIYKVPTLVLTFKDGEIKGSGRAPDGYDLHQLLKASESLLTGCGGHKVAAGLSLLPEKLNDFKKLFSENVTKHAKVNVELAIDAECTIHELYDSRLGMTTTLLEPFGNGNTLPTFLIKGVKCISSWERGQSVYLCILDEKTNNSMVISKFRARFDRFKLQNATLDVVVSLANMYFGGYTCAEYRLVDMKVTYDSGVKAHNDLCEDLFK